MKPRSPGDCDLEPIVYDGVEFAMRLNGVMVELWNVSEKEATYPAVTAQCLLWFNPQVHLHSDDLRSRATVEWIGGLRDAIARSVRPFREPVDG
ncbi:hypothetical protein [Salininema proteolyticum]|uniref:Uncharacterized protein n=1 Tax=Salininema proteolyticum TaxID=1607685 RepID=A0ABV8U6E7_9ACTN